MTKKVRIKVNLEPVLAETLDAIADEIGADPLIPRPSRSEQLAKGAMLYVQRARKRLRFKRVVEVVERRFAQTSTTRVVVLGQRKANAK